MNKNWQSVLEKIDPITVSLLETFSKVAGEIPWLIVGATARDLYAYFFQLPIVRATRDIDLAIQLRSWDEFTDVKKRLLDLDKFK